MNARPVGRGQTQRIGDEADRQVLEQEVARLRTLLREARADTRKETWAQARRQFKVHVAGLALITLVIGGLIGHYGFRGEPSKPEPAQVPASPWSDPAGSDNPGRIGDETAAAPWPISVYVSGAVANAQVVELSPGSLVADALERAGGADADADLDAINLAEPVTDNQHIVIPRLTDRGGTVVIAPSEATWTPVVLIDINSASANELESLPYIGETKAADIVTYRKVNGPFERIEELQNVPGIGPTTYKHIAHLITTGH